MRDQLTVSVVVCTLNRAASLERTLASLFAQSFPCDRYEIILVDNGSRDRTRAVVRQFQERATHCRLTYCHHPALGISRARNRGLSEARAAVVAFIDDDAVAAPNWLEVIAESLQDGGPVTATGGPVLPPDEAHVPRWLPRRLRSHLSLLDYGPESITLRYPHYPFGTNMAVVRESAQRAGGFDPLMGRSGLGSFMTGEETDLFLRMNAVGGVVRYEPKMVVWHDVDACRLTPAWIQEQSFWIGHSSAVIERKTMSPPSLAWRVSAALVAVGAGSLASLVATALRNRCWQVYANCLLRNRLGYLRGFFNSRQPIAEPLHPPVAKVG